MKELYQDSVDQYSSMKNYKLTTTPEEMCRDVRAQFLIPLLNEAYLYEYKDEPQYGKLIFMMEHCLLKMDCIPDKYFTWFNP